ncbi:hypothetical protein [Nocardia africana]|uniref:Uncharacterized protein n=1 Tax=Nocardia africana TaxID=134964 RepID=A0A378X5N8_9NOCA|nr:hypothetical protein [Nocardia africana]MCC3317341.1 hypothetical protein [Nocardia africana]SUA48074.1 Uncharacterised protein [Nocardia africana]
MTRSGGEDLAGLEDHIITGLRGLAPPGWQRLEASFASTVVTESALFVVDDGDGPIRCQVSEEVWASVRRHRQVAAELRSEPWWRMVVRADADAAEVVVDHGAEPFPGEQLFAPQAYLADLEHYPRGRLPVWLAAYIGRGESQSRPPRAAWDRMRADRSAGVRAVPVTGELPDLRTLWARWAVLASAFVAVGSERGPRIGPSVGIFESAGHSGSTLTLLPGDRAVLSGGVWEAPALDLAYNGGGAMPNVFAGAPDWVADPVLNPRVMTGMLSFCFWWDGGQWYRGESAPMPECAAALPAVWTADTVARVVADVVENPSPDAAESLVSAAQAAAVTREAVVQVVGDDSRVDVPGALFQFVLADLIAGEVAGIGEAEALKLVRDHIRERGYDTADFPLTSLRATRVSVGWMVRSPVPDNDIALDRAVFYVADDGVVERSSTSVPLSVFVTDFERRFRLRVGGRI